MAKEPFPTPRCARRSLCVFTPATWAPWSPAELAFLDYKESGEGSEEGAAFTSSFGQKLVSLTESACNFFRALYCCLYLPLLPSRGFIRLWLIRLQSRGFLR
jgi:hypothetical protein